MWRQSPFSSGSLTAERAPPQTDGSEEVSIRRRRPAGANKLECGPTFDFLMETVDKDGKYVENTDNRPRNILEEIVWYKDTEIAQVLRSAFCPCPKHHRPRLRGARVAS